MRATDVVGLAGYAVATPFVVSPSLFKRMWHARDARLFAVHEAGVVMIVAGWLARDRTPAALPNAAYGAALAVAWVRHRRR